MFRGVLATCLILATLVLGAYSLGTRRERADLAYVNASGIGTLDPAAMTWKQDIRVALNVWEGLAAYDPTAGEVAPAAATTPEVSADGLTYRFAIRSDARWSNGEAVTAEDFIRGWRRAIEPGTAGDYAFFILDYIAGAREYYSWRNAFVASLSALPHDSAERTRLLKAHAGEMDRRFQRVGLSASRENVLTVQLVRPCPYFLDLCTFATMLPIHASIEQLRASQNGINLTNEGLVAYDPQWTKPNYRRNGYTGVVTNGAYAVESWSFKRFLRMRVNSFHRDAETIECQTVDMVVIGDLNSAMLAYERGDLDFLPETETAYVHELVRLATTGERKDLHNFDVFGTYFYLFNCIDAELQGVANPFVDARVRRAFAISVDRALIAECVTGRGEQPMGNIVPTGMIEGYAPPPPLQYDPAEARRLLAEAGFPGGDGLPPIDLLYNTGFHHERVCDAMAEMWRVELGATVRLRGREVKTFSEDRRARRFMIARAGWYGDYADPTTYLDLFASENGHNDSGHRDARFEELLNQARGLNDGRARLKLLRRAEARLLHETTPLIPLFQQTQLIAIKPYVQGLIPNARLIFPFHRARVNR